MSAPVAPPWFFFIVERESMNCAMIAIECMPSWRIPTLYIAPSNVILQAYSEVIRADTKVEEVKMTLEPLKRQNTANSLNHLLPSTFKRSLSLAWRDISVKHLRFLEVNQPQVHIWIGEFCPSEDNTCLKSELIFSRIVILIWDIASIVAFLSNPSYWKIVGPNALI